MGLVNSWSMFVPKKTIFKLYGVQKDSTGAIMIYLNDIDESSNVMSHLRGVLEEAGYSILEHDPRPFFMKFEVVSGQNWDGQRLDLTIWKDGFVYAVGVSCPRLISFLLVLVLLS